MAGLDFVTDANELLQDIQNFINSDDSQNFQQLKPICIKFLKFYKDYYDTNYQLNEAMQKEFLQLHQQELQILNNNNDINIDQYNNSRKENSIRGIIDSSLGKVRALQSALTFFKTTFLKSLGYDFIQQIVVEIKEEDSSAVTPVIIQMNDFQGMADFITSISSDFQGKLRSNKDMLIKYKQTLNTKEPLYQLIYPKQEYVKIYNQTRRRLNIFYENTKKDQFGDGLLLYQPGGPRTRWKKFFVNNLGDLKEGFVGMIIHQQELQGISIEEGIEKFTKYIGQVDNAIATLIQDIQKEEKQISVKSGAGNTGAHNDLINLIQVVASGNITAIQEEFDKDKLYTSSGKGRRNRLYNDKEARDKIASKLENSSEASVEKVLARIINEIKKS